MKKNIALIISFLGLNTFLLAQKSLVISDTTSSIGVCEYTSVFRDSTKKMTFEKVQQQKFLGVNKPILQYPFSQDVFWFRFRVRNESNLNQNNWYLTWSDGLQDYIDVYVPQSNGSYNVQKGGLLTPKTEKAYNGSFPLYSINFLPKNKNVTIYVRIKPNGTIVGTLTLLTHQLYISQMPNRFAVVWLIIGIQLLRMLYNIVLAWYIKNSSFRWYSFHTVIVTLSVLGSFGLIGEVLNAFPTVAGVINSAFYELMPATYSLFIFSLLNVWKNYPRVRWLFVGVIATSVLQIVAHFIIPRIYVQQVNSYLFLMMVFLLTATTIHALIKRLSFNSYLLIPCLITLIPFAFLNLQDIGAINYSWIYPLIYITNFLEIFALSLVIGKVIEATEDEKIQSEKALLTEKLEADKLLELDRLKTQFFTNISHEFRTPLTLLMSPLEDFQKKYPAETLIPMMQRNLVRLQTLINQLLDLSKLEVGQMQVKAQKGDLAVFLKQLMASFESLAQSRDIAFRITQNEAHYETAFDADKIEKILTNLLSNAFKFTDNGGTIAAKIDFKGDQLTIKIADSGIGIEAARLNKIFNRFYQIDASDSRKYEGTGIGLALVKELVEVLKGQVSVSSEVGIGTTFVVQLPVGDVFWQNHLIDTEIPLPVFESQEINPDNGSIEVLENNKKPIVLVVEDNPDLRNYIKGILQKNYQVIEAVDGQDGVEKAFRYIPDLVILDLMMPNMDGFGVCKTLKNNMQSSHIPIIMLTAKATQQDKNEGLNLGADGYLAKPFNTDELKIRVANLIKQRELLKEKYSQITLIENTESQEKLLSMDEVFIQKAYKVIEMYISDSSFEASQFCEALAMSRTTMHRKLKALTNQSTTEFIRNYRLEKAHTLLRNKAGNVSDIAYQVGFESLPYFSKTFQEHFGLLPSELK